MEPEDHSRRLLLGSDECLRDVIIPHRSREIKDEDIVLDLKPEKRAALYEKMGLSQ